MKRFWLVLLSLGLIAAFSTSAFAVDVKFSGSYYAAGLYLDKTSVADVSGMSPLSTAMYFQRLRVKTEFVVSPGLSVITRFDAMERAWGNARTSATSSSTITSLPTMGAASNATVAENENIAFDVAHLNYVSPIGIFAAGYMLEGTWGTDFMNTEVGTPKLSYILPIGNFLLFLQYAKAAESSFPYVNAYTGTQKAASDNDYDLYYLFGIYTVKNFQAGMLYMYIRNAEPRPLVVTDGVPFAVFGGNYVNYYHLFSPFVKATLGPVYVEGEVRYNTGQARKYDSGVLGDISYTALAAFISATANFGPVYIGGSFAYLSGDDPTTLDKIEGNLTGGLDWNPCLVLWNADRYTWAGGLTGNGTSANSSAMANAWFYQVKGGVKPTDKLDIGVAVSFATADQVASTWISKNYGYEVDVTAKYKITNNLEYMLGFGYLITGDYFKGTNAAAAVNNDYLVINKLTVTF